MDGIHVYSSITKPYTCIYMELDYYTLHTTYFEFWNEAIKMQLGLFLTLSSLTTGILYNKEPVMLQYMYDSISSSLIAMLYTDLLHVADSTDSKAIKFVD